LKELLNPIFSFDPTHRPSIAEILKSKWWNGPTASHEEVLAEFERRKKKVEENLELERKIRQDNLNIHNANQQGQNGLPDWRGTVVRVRNIDAEENYIEEEEATIWDDINTKITDDNLSKNKLPAYEDETYKPSTFFSALGPKAFFQCILYAAIKLEGKPEVNLEKSRLKITKQFKQGNLKCNIN